MNRFQNIVTRSASGLGRSLVVKGILSILFGATLAAWPGPTVGVIVLFFSAFALADGIVSLWTAATATAAGQRSPHVAAGVVSLSAGTVGLVWPGITALATLWVIGVWALVRGITELSAAITAPPHTEHRGLVALVGTLGVAFGGIMLAHPERGAVALVSTIAALAVVNGVTFVAAGMRMGRRADEVEGRLRRSAPTAA
jgi:uncharacterized membrane protein HdeD (DUF308 family)